MQTKLEQCGNLAVPVDESGTATGRATYTPTCPYCGRPFETVNTERELLMALEQVQSCLGKLVLDFGEVIKTAQYFEACDALSASEAAIAKAKGTSL